MCMGGSISFLYWIVTGFTYLHTCTCAFFLTVQEQQLLIKGGNQLRCYNLPESNLPLWLVGSSKYCRLSISLKCAKEIVHQCTTHCLGLNFKLENHRRHSFIYNLTVPSGGTKVLDLQYKNIWRKMCVCLISRQLRHSLLKFGLI